jgi:hypothetical protein
MHTLFKVFLSGVAGAFVAEVAEPKIAAALGNAVAGDTATKVLKYGTAGGTVAASYWLLSKAMG